MNLVPAWLAAALAVVVVCQSALANASAVQEASAKSKSKVVQVYADGNLTDGWHDSSKGCMKCNWASTIEARNGSDASFSAWVAAWGSLVIAADKQTYSTNSVLDFYAKGSGLNLISLYFADSSQNTYTRDVRFTSINETITKMSPPDADGWYHIKVKISLLTPDSNGVFDRIYMDDVSGMGFRLAIDDIKIVPSDLAVDFAASSFTLPSDILPVFNKDLTALKAAPNRYIVKLKQDAKIGEVDRICQELSGKLTTSGQRFEGMCNSPLSSLGTPTIGSSTIRWPLMTISVRSDEDLDAMRRSLGDQIEYFEADLQAFTSVRALREAASREVAANEVAGDNSRPAWASDVDSEPKPWTPPPVDVVEVETIAPVTEGPNNATTQGVNNKTDADTHAGNGTAPKVENIGVSPAPHSKDIKASLPAEDATEVKAAEGSVSSWGLDRLDQTSLPLNGYYSSGDYDGRGVHIYILDTGCRTSHADFRGRVGDGASAVGGGINDDNGHGTHVSGTALGGIHGVARAATLHVVKVFGADGSGSYSNIISGMNWVKDHKARNGIKSAIISMSLVGPRASSLNDAVENMAAAGITVVSAAGNNRGADACTMSPSSAPSAITVGASTDRDALASFSNIGRCLTLFAPGQSIVSAGRKSDNEEVIMSGTSMATPHVTGVAALYLQYRPGASPAEVKAALKGAAVGAFFESSSPQLLLNAISSRLRGTNANNPAPAPSTPTTTNPQPSTPTTTTKPAPTPSTPTTSLGSFGSKPSWCSSCSWCLGC